MSTYKGRTVTVLEALHSIPSPGSDAGVTTATAAVEAAVAVLEADGATPTQAHVNSLRTVWNTLKTSMSTEETQETTVEIIRNADNSLSKVPSAEVT